MTWTYDPTQLGNNSVYEVRLLIGDTDCKQQLLQDEEIIFLLKQNSSAVDSTALDCVRRIIATLSKQVDYQIGPEKVYASQKLANFEKLFKSLQVELQDVSHLVLSQPASCSPGINTGQFDNPYATDMPDINGCWEGGGPGCGSCGGGLMN